MPPPTKMASGGGSPASASGAAPTTMSQRRHAERGGVAGDDRGARRVALDGDGAARSSPARSHSIAIEPQPAPMSHNVSPGSGASARQGRGADLALGQLAVMLEGVVGQPGEPRQRARAGRRRGIRSRSC